MTPPTAMDFQQAALTIFGATVAYALYSRYRNSAVRDVPGPKNPSWICGISGSPHTLNVIISQILGQDTNGTGDAKRRTPLRSAFWKNTGP